MKYCTRVRLKPSNDCVEFELYRAISKHNIAKTLFALGHEPNDTLFNVVNNISGLITYLVHELAAVQGMPKFGSMQS